MWKSTQKAELDCRWWSESSETLMLFFFCTFPLSIPLGCFYTSTQWLESNENESILLRSRLHECFSTHKMITMKSRAPRCSLACDLPKLGGIHPHSRSSRTHTIARWHAQKIPFLHAPYYFCMWTRKIQEKSFDVRVRLHFTKIFPFSSSTQLWTLIKNCSKMS